MTIQEYNTNIWMFYLQLENDFYNTLGFVEFSEDNFSTYSKEYAKQLLAIGSEVDIVCKELCKNIAPNQPRNNISTYAEVLCNYENFTSEKVIYEYTGEEFEPIRGWTSNDSPRWWRAYNSVKHDRLDSDNQKKANLENVFNALAGLYMLNRFLCKKVCEGNTINEPEIKSRLFKMKGWGVTTRIGGDFALRTIENGNIGILV